MNLNESEIVPADFSGNAFDDWIGGATVSKRSVPIYGKPGLFAEYEQLERDLEAAKASERHGVEITGGESARIEARLEALYHEWMASKSTWTVRALDPDELKAIDEQMVADGFTQPDFVPEPKPAIEPMPLPKKHSDADAKTHILATEQYKKALAEYPAKKAEYDEAFPAYLKAVEEFADEVNLRIISKAVVEIEFAGGRTQDGVTVEQLHALKERLGKQQLLKLLKAAELAATSEPEIPAFFSQSTSEDDQT